MDTDDNSAEADNLDKLGHYLALSLSLPERVARALSALVGGSMQLLTNTFIPLPIKGSNSYRFTLGMFQTFLIRNIAGVDQANNDVELQDRFMHRKLLGSSIEAAGLLTMRLSPVWIFAIASDAARGGQIFLQRLVKQLKENGVIAADTHPETLEQLLAGIHEMSRKGAAAIDMPPLTADEIRILADELRESTESLTENAAGLLPTFESIWEQIEGIARAEKLSMAEVLGMLSVRAASITDTSIGAADAVGQTGYRMVDELLLDDYRKTLGEISRVGAYPYAKQHMQPFVANARSHFDFGAETLSQRWFKKAFGKIASRIRNVADP
jgi:hypothetical protein